MKLLIIAGEESGDLHASNLCKALRSLNPEIQLLGLGGQRMQDVGVTIFHNLVERAVVGFWEPIKQLGFFRNLMNELDQWVACEKPDAVILVDYPGFNLRFAERIRKEPVPIIYYISPQVWAWGKGRVKKIAQLVDKMLVIFPFEKEIYTPFGLSTEFVGHPLLDVIDINLNQDEICKKYQLDNSAPIITLLPGSRKQEIVSLLPIMLSAGKIIQQKMSNVQFILLLAREGYLELATQMIDESGLIVKVSVEDKYDIRAASVLSLVSSGTATLEGAIVGTPMVVVYKVSFLTAVLARFLLRISNIALVNVVAGSRIVPELVQHQLTPDALAKEALAILSDPGKISKIKTQLAVVKNKLGSPGASSRAAKLILDYLT
ncbi:MAG: lipid-A-disaccharide synthase [bacterium]|nr:lipid-A-disaccharide synthase [bacterium]